MKRRAGDNALAVVFDDLGTRLIEQGGRDFPEPDHAFPTFAVIAGQFSQQRYLALKSRQLHPGWLQGCRRSLARIAGL